MLGMPDQMTFFMAFFMLCFAGLLVMFYFVLRAIDELSKAIRVERSALVSSMRDMEASMQRLEQAMHDAVRARSAVQADSFLPATEKARSLRKEERFDFSPQDLSDDGVSQEAEASGLLSMSSDQQKGAGSNEKVLRLDGIEPLLLK